MAFVPLTLRFASLTQLAFPPPANQEEGTALCTRRLADSWLQTLPLGPPPCKNASFFSWLPSFARFILIPWYHEPGVPAMSWRTGGPGLL